MPELPEVECVRRTMSPALLERRVREVEIGLSKLTRPTPENFRAGIIDRRIVALGRHGKLLTIELDDASFWAIHLGMTGQVILGAERPNLDHVHISIGFEDGSSLFYRDVRQFGFMAFCRNRAELKEGPLRNMGPDALQMDLATFVTGLGHRKAPIKSLLLDQRILAGVGNIYADEALHRAGISPLARPADLGEGRLGILHGVLHEILDEAICKGGSSIRDYIDARGRAGSFQDSHRVYQRTGSPCPNCGKEIKKTVLGGRSTHYCPACQKEH